VFTQVREVSRLRAAAEIKLVEMQKYLALKKR